MRKEIRNTFTMVNRQEKRGKRVLKREKETENEDNSREIWQNDQKATKSRGEV